jgi:prepilin-type N-terminal cleavage/methylation domain-containing protein/prepilin-type processing-associated H-X9-DG protein
MARRKQGFTLIELLVVIAIIAILAAMLFPVFARARESARKIQCLSNVKNIALAVQMYLTDYDRFPPTEHRQDVLNFYMGVSGEDSVGSCVREAAFKNNPYLKWPVLLDEYTKNRDVWRCPSARVVNDISSLDPMGGDWFTRVEQLYNDNGTCSPFMQCGSPYPPGWSGTVTDSFLQQTCGGAGQFEQGLNGLNDNLDLKTSQVEDPARWLAVCEVAHNDTWNTSIIAYGDWCGLGCAMPQEEYGCIPMVQWENCSWTVDCGAGDPKFATDANARKPYARHMGGTNLGFADGHAAWMSSEAVLSGSVDERWFIPQGRKNPNPAILGPVGLCMMPYF